MPLLHRCVNNLPYWPYRKSGPTTACGLYPVPPEWHSPQPSDIKIRRANPLPKGDAHTSGDPDKAVWSGDLCPTCFPEGYTTPRAPTEQG